LKSWTSSMWPRMTAQANAVLPLRSVTSTRAPHSCSRRRTSSLRVPRSCTCIACMRGVHKACK
jgi:hypothetical protein